MSLFLCLQGNTYHFRKSVPAKLRPYLGQREIKKTLKTGNMLEARRKSLLLNIKFEQFLSEVKTIMVDTTLSEFEKRKLISNLFYAILKQQDDFLDAEYLDFPEERKWMSPNIADKILDDDRNDFEKKLFTACMKDHTSRKYDIVKTLLSGPPDAAFCEALSGTESPKEKTKNTSRIYNFPFIVPEECLTGSFLHELSLANLDACRFILERKQGKNPAIPEIYQQILHEKSSGTQSAPVNNSSEQNTDIKTRSVPLTQAIEEYIKDREHTGRWSDKSKRENISCYNNFLEFAGRSIDCSQIHYHLVAEFRDALTKLPANRKKIKEYRTKTIAELIKMKVTKTMSITTVNKNLNRLSSLLKFAVKLEYMSTNPAENIEISTVEKDSELRAVFTQDDLEKMFHSEQYKTDSFLHPFMFWTPLIALFTGMRQTEIAQLYLTDLYQDEATGIWVININDGKDKKVKNKNSRRTIPLHPFLASTLNLPKYKQLLEKQEKRRLFPELPYGRDGYGQNVSRWFNGHGDGKTRGFKLSCDIEMPTDGTKKDFHSFRHTLIDHLKQKMVNLPLLHEFDGHSYGTMTMDRYGKAYNIQTVYNEIVCKITFDKKLDLDHLVKSKYVIK
ncbi:site-specific integrase [Maridesulfovibrio frigidus]|uniref:site-specific integrase n=1 Tax=Maridesulfovibrio frigidus TaxID=340956 RepID=UPI0004E12D34|nr:site-specific integrase [Maridesulfovibrio frigidus]